MTTFYFYILIVSGGFLSVAGIKMVGLIFGNSMELPYFFNVGNIEIKPDTWFIFYPCLFIQMDYWATRMEWLV